jgi:hypothetical protein
MPWRHEDHQPVYRAVCDLLQFSRENIVVTRPIEGRLDALDELDERKFDDGLSSNGTATIAPGSLKRDTTL